MNNPISDAVRALRRQHKLTQQGLAALADIPRATLANIEKTSANPSIQVVIKIASALGVTVDDLLSKNKSVNATVVNRSNMAVYRQDNGNFISTTVSPLNAALVNMNDINMMPGCSTRGTPHPDGANEFFLVLEGTATITVEEQVYELEAGNLIYFPGNLPHCYANNGLKPVHAVSVVYMS
jgi:XRE family transcriptional regulator, regulator of sulfur utilization